MGSILDFIYAPHDIPGTIERLCEPQCKIVGLTITEKGYCWNKLGNSDTSHTLVMQDISDIDRPASVPGYDVSAVCSRRTLKPKR